MAGTTYPTAQQHIPQTGIFNNIPAYSVKDGDNLSMGTVSCWTFLDCLNITNATSNVLKIHKQYYECMMDLLRTAYHGIQVCYLLSTCVECSFSPVYLHYLPGTIFEVSPDHIHTIAPATVTVAALHICIH
jgi:hypothetical protein